MSEDKYKYGDYVELKDDQSCLDGNFSAKKLRKIADDMDVLANETPYPIEPYPRYIPFPASEMKVEARICSNCKRNISSAANTFFDADDEYCVKCAIKLHTGNAA